MSFCFVACGTKGNEDNTPKTSLELLENVWNSYSSTEKFYAVGGDSSKENQCENGPGKYSLDKKENLLLRFCINETAAEEIDDAASLMHMMLVNNFTAVSLHIKNSDSIQNVADMIRTEILNKKWIDGFPEKWFICSVGDYLVSAFGLEEFTDTFALHISEVYPNMQVIYSENIL